MMRRAALLLAAVSVLAGEARAAGEAPPAASPFPVVGRAKAPEGPHRMAYVSLLAGAGLVAWSFDLAGRADRTYARYLVATADAEIDALYDRTLLHDRLARATLIGGEGLVAAGLYLRFIRRPRPGGLAVEVSPTACALAWRF